MIEKGKEPTLAVVLPCRNGGDYLVEALESLERQTETPDVIQFSNNNSHDKTLEHFRAFAQRNQNVRVISAEKYLELGESFNFATSNVKEDWIYFLHSDDILSPKAVKVIKREIAKVCDCVGIISFQAEWVDESTNLVRAVFGLGSKKRHSGITFIQNNLGGSNLNFGAVVINRRIFAELGGFDQANSLWLDLKFYHKLVLSHEILEVPIPILRYRVYTSIRSSDKRIEMEQDNFKYWNNEYLPKLAGDLKFDLPKPGAPQDLLTKIKLFLKRENKTYKVIKMIKIVLRKRMDKLNIGMFGSP